MVAAKEKLDSWINKNVSDFCSSSASSHTDDKKLHCAHFVSHCLNLHRVRSSGKTGHFETGVGKIAKQCFNARKIDAKGKIEESGVQPVGLKLIYVAKNGKFRVKSGVIKKVETPRHIGFYLNGTVWHYENDSASEKVVSYRLGNGTSDSKFVNRYGSGCEMWITDPPVGYTVRSFSDASE